MRPPGDAMALDHPALNLPVGGTVRSSRVLELAVVIVLTVAVVVVAALWGSSSDTAEPVSLGSVEPVSQAPAPAPAAGALPSQGVEPATTVASERVNSAVAAEPAVATAESARTTSAAESAAIAEIPSFAGRQLPSSFERYQVQRGETLDSIAEAQGLTVSELVLWNSHLDKDAVLIPGEWLSIPQWDGPAVADEMGLVEEGGKSGRGGG